MRSRENRSKKYNICKPTLVALALSCMFIHAAAHALPGGGSVVGGNASISTTANTLLVQQSTSSAIYNWQSFSIGKTESVIINQPTAQSIAINYVLGNSPSLIEGKLTSNGQIFLSNPNGILLGRGSQINAAGMVLDAGKAVFENVGQIQASSGNISASAGYINNVGIIEANKATASDGKIVLSASTTIANTGSVLANGTNGGSIRLVAPTILNSGNLSANGLNQGGTITLLSAHHIFQTATASSRANGQVGGNIAYIAPTASAQSTVVISGEVQANGKFLGGSVTATGGTVDLMASNIQTVGGMSGGQINIGGGFQGRNASIPNAQITQVNGLSKLDAGGILNNGGSVVIWSNKQTLFSGDINATGGVLASQGGKVEVSGKQLGFNGFVKTNAANGVRGTLLLDPVNIVIESGAAGPKSFLTLAGQGAITELPNGNLLIVDSTLAGSVSLYDGATGALLSSLVGATNHDFVGFGGVKVLSNGNFAVASPYWRNGGLMNAPYGAVTWGSATSGVNGVISAANSLVGDTPGDMVGWGGVAALPSGNYLAISPYWHGVGAVTWANGASGGVGNVTAVNSLVGSTPGDAVGISGVKVLFNGNYVVGSDQWGGTRGAATWGNGLTGVTGVVSSLNSLVGAAAGDRIGIIHNGVADDLVEIGADNYLVLSPTWGGGKGSVTWGSGTTGVNGIVSAANSLVGSTADNLAALSLGDRVGSNVVILSNRNYLIQSAFGGAGAVTWGNGNAGVVGVVSPTNSLVGSVAGDGVGAQGVMGLTNGNYVVVSSNWNGGAGAVTWGNGAAGIAGVVSNTNSIVGAVQDNPAIDPLTGLPIGGGDHVGGGWIYRPGIGSLAVGGVTELSNGNFVIASPNWGGGAGAVTWGNGASGVVGSVNSVNSLVGTPTDQLSDTTVLSNGNYVVRSTFGGIGAVTWGSGTMGLTGLVSAANRVTGMVVGDNVGARIQRLPNGNYLIGSPGWGGGAGAVTWVSGNAPTAGVVSAANSLVGVAVGDNVGASIQLLSNGNCLVASPGWGGGVGAFTWVSGNAPTAGVVSAANSLVGSVVGDNLGARIQPLPNGNYLIISPGWGGGAGAVTWGVGNAPTAGVVSAANSLVGSAAGDNVGGTGMIPGMLSFVASPITVLPNGNYLVSSINWGGNRGAVTWGSGTAGVSGVISAANSLVGGVAGDNVGQHVTALSNGNYLVLSPMWNSWAGAATWGSGIAGVTGAVSAANSLVGEVGGNFFTGDQVGSQYYGLANGNYIVSSNRGWAWTERSSTGTVGLLSASNPVMGNFITTLSGNRFVLSMGNPLSNTWLGVFDGSINAATSLLTLPTNMVGYASVLGNGGVVDPGAITAITNAGTAVTLQASNDIRVKSAIITAPNPGVLRGGDLTLSAGRNLLINADINTAGGNLTLIANDSVANGVVGIDRAPGPAMISFGAGSAINTGGGTLTMDLRNGGVASGVFLHGLISAGAVNINSVGYIKQTPSSSINTANLSTTATGGTSLIGSNNIGSFAATDTGSVRLINTAAALAVTGVASTGVDISNSGNIQINGLINAGFGNVVLNASGLAATITEGVAGSIVTNGILTPTAGSAISLTGNNAVAELTIQPACTNCPSASVSLVNSMPTLTLNHVFAPSISVSNVGNLAINGTLNAGTVSLNATGSITESASGTVNTLGTLTTAASGGTTLSGWNQVGTFAATDTGTVILNNSLANVLQVGSITAGGLTITNNSSALSLIGAVNVNGQLQLTSLIGGINQTPGASLSVSGTSNFNSGLQSTVLANTGNNLRGVVGATGYQLALKNNGALTFGTVRLTGSLNAVSTGLISQQVGTGIVVAGPSVLNAGISAIRLGNAINDLNAVTAIGRGVILRDMNALTVTLNSSGASSITTSGLLNIAGKSLGGLTVTNIGVGPASRYLTNFGATTVIGRLIVTSKGIVKKKTPATVVRATGGIKVNGVPKTAI